MITKKSHDSLEILNDYIQNLNKNHFFQTGERGEGGERGVWRRKAKCPEVEEDKEEKEKEKDKDKKFLRAHRPKNQSKKVQEILADLKKIHVSLMMMTIQVQRAGGGFDLF